MAISRLRSLVILAAATFFGGFCPAASAQPGDVKPAEQQKATDAKKGDAPAAPAQSAAVARTPSGPAGNPECVWLGKRVINLLVRDDLDTAFRHLDLYDRFGCPGSHIQASFRCLVLQPPLDQKASDALEERVKNCWNDPSTIPPPAASAPAAAAVTAPPPPATAGTGAH